MLISPVTLASALLNNLNLDISKAILLTLVGLIGRMLSCIIVFPRLSYLDGNHYPG